MLKKKLIEEKKKQSKMMAKNTSGSVANIKSSVDDLIQFQN